LLSHGPFVYLGRANGTFTDIRTTCGFSNLRKSNEHDSTDWHGFSLADYDNDGNVDLYIAEGAGAHRGLLKRDLLFHGDGTFTYVSDVAGIASYGDRGREGFWVDYSNDGFLDLFVKNYKSANDFIGANRLYKNNRHDTFTQIVDAAGLTNASYKINGGSVTSFADYDNDGRMDIAFAGDGAPEALYHHRRNGTFGEVTAAEASTLEPLATVLHGRLQQ
jgi:enediyne biosynthesis protein E4